MKDDRSRSGPGRDDRSSEDGYHPDGTERKERDASGGLVLRD
jgi:hypothetical protein